MNKRLVNDFDFKLIFKLNFKKPPTTIIFLMSILTVNSLIYYKKKTKKNCVWQ